MRAAGAGACVHTLCAPVGSIGRSLCEGKKISKMKKLILVERGGCSHRVCGALRCPHHERLARAAMYQPTTHIGRSFEKIISRFLNALFCRRRRPWASIPARRVGSDAEHPSREFILYLYIYQGRVRYFSRTCLFLSLCT